MNSITIKGRTYDLPIFLPDATKGFVKGLDALDLENTQTRGVVVNTYHLSQEPGLDFLKNNGGIKSFMNYEGLVTSDSGGWQVFSLIHKRKTGKITDEGVIFDKEIFTPEDSIEMQFAIGSDIVVCLDDFTAPEANDTEIRKSVERTINWAQRSKAKFEELISKNSLTEETRPLLLAVMQGGFDLELRKYCAEELIKIGFDGLGYGGYAIKSGVLDLELSKYVSDLIPDTYFKFALGTGRPADIANLYNFGWRIFDCTLPTRDARHQRLYTHSKQPKSIEDLTNSEFYEYCYINKSIYKHDNSKIDDFCDCLTCTNFTKAYLHHLFKVQDTLAYRLATIHNLRFYTKLIEKIKLWTK